MNPPASTEIGAQAITLMAALMLVVQLLMIVKVIVAQRQPVDALREHLAKLVLDQQRRPKVGETRSHPPQQTDLATGLAQQKRTAIGRYLAGRETGLDAARKM